MSAAKIYTLHAYAPERAMVVDALRTADDEEDRVVLDQMRADLDGAADDSIAEAILMADDLDAMAEAKDARSKAYRLEAGKLTRRATAIRAMVLDVMLAADRKKAGDDRARAIVVMGPEKVVVDDVDLATVPDQYVKYEPQLQKSALKDDLKAGAEYDWCRLVREPYLKAAVR